MIDTRYPITWDSLQALVRAAPTHAPRRRRFAAASVAQILSDTKRGLVAVLRQREGLSQAQARERVLSDDLRPLLPLAPEAARQAVFSARGTTRSARTAARNAAARCRQALRVVDPNLVPRGRRGRDHGAAATPAWRPLLDALAVPGARPRERRALAIYRGLQTTRACLLRVAHFLAARGVDGPEGLPLDPDTFACELRGAGMTQHVVNNLLHAVRKARLAAENRGLDVSRIPLWPKKRKGASYSRFGEDWSADPKAGLARDLPQFARWLDTWLKATQKVVSPDTQETVTQATYRVGYAIKCMAVAGMLPGVNLTTLTPFALGETLVPGQRLGGLAVDHSERDGIAASVGLTTPPRDVPLLHAITRYLLDVAPIRQIVRAEQEFVPPGVRGDLERVWLLVRAVVRDEMVKQQPERWAAADLQYREWLKAVRALHEAAGKPTARDIGRLLNHVTLPQLVVLGLPWFTLVQLPALASAVKQARTPADRAEAITTYRTALFRWAALAVPASVPLRLDQFQFGRVGTGADREFELQATFRPDGALDRVLRVRTRVGGRLHHFPDNKDAALKQRLAPMAEWVCRPSILDLDRFAEYLREVWWPRAVARGLDRGRTMAQAFQDGDLALFLSDRNGSRINRWGGYGGNGSDIADACGEALLSVMREALGRAVPGTKDEALKAGWGYLLTEHPLRHLYATYWFGLQETHAVVRRVDQDTHIVRSGAQIAREATRDGDKTLKGTYARVTATMKAHLDRPTSSWEHPLIFSRLMDAAEDPNNVVSWSEAWSALLDRCRAGGDALPDPIRIIWEARATTRVQRASAGR
jgi:hypothetical protein